MDNQFNTTGLDVMGGKVDAMGYKVRAAPLIEGENAANVDGVVLSLRQKIHDKNQATTKIPKAKYRKATEQQKQAVTERYRNDIVQNTDRALQIQTQRSLFGLLNSFRQAYYKVGTDKLGGMKDSLYVLTRQPDANTGAFQILSKKNAAQIFGKNNLTELQKTEPVLYAAVRVNLAWNRFVRSAANYLKWANNTDAMIKRVNAKALIKTNAGSAYNLLQLIQRKKKKLQLSGQTLAVMAEKIKAARATGKKTFEDKQQAADLRLDQMINDNQVSVGNQGVYKTSASSMEQEGQQQQRGLTENGLYYDSLTFNALKPNQRAFISRWSKQDFNSYFAFDAKGLPLQGQDTAWNNAVNSMFYLNNLLQ